MTELNGYFERFIGANPSYSKAFEEEVALT